MTTSESQQAQISIRGLHKRYGDNVVLNGIDFDVLPGRVIVTMAQRSGKSTFLRCVTD
jgi:polar amino acid transport system ATP-binding protein